MLRPGVKMLWLLALWAIGAPGCETGPTTVVTPPDGGGQGGAAAGGGGAAQGGGAGGGTGGAGGGPECAASADCPGQDGACEGRACVAGTCAVSRAAAGEPCDQGVCDGDGACVPALIAGVDYPVIAQGGQLVITGAGFTGAAAVTVGGVPQSHTVDSDAQIVIPALDDATPAGAQQVVIATQAGSSAPLEVTVIRLQISELDADTPGNIDALEFVEVSAGMPGVDLSGYTLVLWDGATDTSTAAVELAAITNAEGRLVIGGAALAPSLTLASGAIDNGPDGVGIHQGPPSTFPQGTALTAAGLIDALVHETADPDDDELLDVLLTSAIVSPARRQVNEAVNGLGEAQSIQRCGDGRRNGSKFGVKAPPSPGAANSILLCP